MSSQRKVKKEFILYSAVSVLALLVDVATLYLTAVILGIPEYLAAAFAYATGLVVHYILSIRYVFSFRRMATQRRTEAMVYALTGLAGMVLSAGIVHLGVQMLGQPLMLSKMVAVLVTFVVVFAIRKTALFSAEGNTRKSTS